MIQTINITQRTHQKQRHKLTETRQEQEQKQRFSNTKPNNVVQSKSVMLAQSKEQPRRPNTTTNSTS